MADLVIAEKAALTAMADAIREKTGTTDPITWLEELGFSEAINAIEAGGGVFKSFTFTPAQTGVYWQRIDAADLEKIFCIFWTRIDKQPHADSQDSSASNGDQYEAHSGVTYVQGWEGANIQTITTNFNGASGWWNPFSASANVSLRETTSSETYYGGATVRALAGTQYDNLSFYVANTGGKGLRIGGTYLVCLIEKGW